MNELQLDKGLQNTKNIITREIVPLNIDKLIQTAQYGRQLINFDVTHVEKNIIE